MIKITVLNQFRNFEVSKLMRFILKQPYDLQSITKLIFKNGKLNSKLIDYYPIFKLKIFYQIIEYEYKYNGSKRKADLI